MENFESLEIGDSIMSDWAQIISDALDILKFDGAVQVICTPFTGHPVGGVLLCGTRMSTKGNV